MELQKTMQRFFKVYTVFIRIASKSCFLLQISLWRRWRKNWCSVQPREDHSEEKRTVWCKSEVCSVFSKFYYAKYTTILVKHPFPSLQLLLCVGDFFGWSAEAQAEWEAYKSGAKKGERPELKTLLVASSFLVRIITYVFWSFWNLTLWFLTCFSTHPYLCAWGSQQWNGQVFPQCRWLWIGW